MRIATMADGPQSDSGEAVAAELLRGKHASVRMIRIGAGQSLPAHSHGESDVMLFVVEGTAILGGDVPAPAGTIAHLRGEEVLRVRCEDAGGVTLLAFLAPAFPPQGEQ